MTDDPLVGDDDDTFFQPKRLKSRKVWVTSPYFFKAVFFFELSTVSAGNPNKEQIQ